jgi:predicted DNA-binding transcriptional regulator YafY
MDFLSGKSDKFSIDFSMFGGDPRHRAAFKIVRSAVESSRFLRFSYTNARLEPSTRTVEPMTVTFRWRSWYLYAFCLNKQDYRLFRIYRIREPVVEESFGSEDREELLDGSLVIRVRMPLDNWVLGYLLSWGEYPEVLEPQILRRNIAESAENIQKIYK